MSDDPKYDIALSFSGAQRYYISQIAETLRARGFAVFYDQFEGTTLLGKELLSYLQKVYSSESSLVAAFISDEYVSTPWTTHEKTSALSRAFLDSVDDVPYFLPFRFDDTPVPGLSPTVRYEDLRQLHNAELLWQEDTRYKQPRHTADFLTQLLVERGLGPDRETLETLMSDEYQLCRLFFLDGEELADFHLPVHQEDLNNGSIEVGAIPPKGGVVAGTYYAVTDPETKWRLSPEKPQVTLLKKGLRVYNRQRINGIDRPSVRQEVIAETYDELREVSILECRKPLTFSVSTIITQNHDTSDGPAVLGTATLITGRSD